MPVGSSDHPRARVIHSPETMLDGVAVCASLICMVHCLGLPLLIAMLPALAGRFVSAEWFHAAVLALAIPISGMALLGGWRRHRLFTPLACGTTGLALMAAGIALSDEAIVETAFTVAGSLSVAAAHIMNWRGRRSAQPHSA